MSLCGRAPAGAGRARGARAPRGVSAGGDAGGGGAAGGRRDPYGTLAHVQSPGADGRLRSGPGSPLAEERAAEGVAPAARAGAGVVRHEQPDRRLGPAPPCSAEPRVARSISQQLDGRSEIHPNGLGSRVQQDEWTRGEGQPRASASALTRRRARSRRTCSKSSASSSQTPKRCVRSPAPTRARSGRRLRSRLSAPALPGQDPAVYPLEKQIKARFDEASAPPPSFADQSLSRASCYVRLRGQ